MKGKNVPFKMKKSPNKFIGKIIKGVLGGRSKSRGSAASRAKAAMFGRYNRPAGMDLGRTNSRSKNTNLVFTNQLKAIASRLPKGGLNATGNIVRGLNRKTASKIGGAVSGLIKKGVGGILGRRR
tara:strand:- start:342 stop:716 length:375 start_codon:yes stop_codon:yes gene_type:complete